MRRAEILPKAIRRFRVTTDSRKTKASPNLIHRDFTSAHPNDLWLSDITYIPTREGWLYLAAVLDAYSRALVGWAMSRTLDTKLAMDALNMAIAHRGPPVTLHSDQGSTYTTGSYREIVNRYGIRLSMSRKGDCWDNSNELREMEVAARSLNLQLQIVEARIPSEFPAAFAAATKRQAGAVLLYGGSVYFAHQAQLVELAAASRLPAIYGVKEFVVAGGLMAYGVDLRDSARRAAAYVDKILKGAKPGDLPIEQPTKFDLVINLKTAKALGLTMPQSLLLRADEVIQ